MTTVTVDVDVDLEDIIDEMDADEVAVLAMYIAASMNKTPATMAINWPEGTLVLDPEHVRPEPPGTVSVTVEVDLNVQDFVSRLDEQEVEELRDRLVVDLDYEEPVSMRALYWACRDGDREKVFEMARRLACHATGRIC